MLFILIFSKDRPFQLQECLRTCMKYICTSANEIVHYYVLCTSSDERTRELYGHVATAFPCVTFVDEAEFGPDFQRILDEMTVIAGVQPALIMFLVDDALFVSSVSVADAALLLLRPGVVVYHCKLHPGVWYSHPASCICEPPQLMPAGASSAMFELLGSKGDWCYPWDLCGSIYLLSAAFSMVQQLRLTDPEALGHPNKLEQRGHKLWHSTRSWPGAPPDVTLRAACPLAPTLVVITVNRVQDVFSNAVYASGEQYNLSALNELVLSSTRILDELYAQCTFPCVHIGMLHLSNDASCEPAPLPRAAHPLVSVLIPAFNAGRHVRAALASVLSQQGLASDQIEVVVVDDGSTDDTLAVVTAVTREYLAQDRVVVLSLRANVGIAVALNEGLTCCRGKYIARLDADDVCVPHRLLTQALFLEQHPCVDVLGSSVFVSKDEDDPESRIIMLPQHPALLKWHMLFYCSIAHPSIMARREAIASGYPLETLCEDNSLWLAMLYPPRGSVQCCFANLGMPLVTLHKHGTNVSSSAFAARATAAASAAGAAMRALAGVDVAHDTTACLRDGASWVSTAITQGCMASHVLEVLQNALLVLQQLLSAALAELETVPFLFSDNTASTTSFRCWEGVTAAAMTAALTADATARAAELGLAALQAFGQAGLPLYRSSLVWPRPASAELVPVMHAEEGANEAAWDWDAPEDGSPVTQAPLQSDDSVLRRIASFLG